MSSSDTDLELSSSEDETAAEKKKDGNADKEQLQKNFEDQLTISERVVKAVVYRLNAKERKRQKELLEYLAALPVSLVDRALLPFVPGTPSMKIERMKVDAESPLPGERSRVACDHAVVGVSAWRVTEKGEACAAGATDMSGR